MPFVSVVFGLLLIALGIWGYWGGTLGLWERLGFADPGRLSGTALIPAYVGAALVVLGLLALKESLLKHAMHGAAMIGLLGFVAAVARIAMTGNVQGVGGTSLSLMALLCAGFVALCVNSFVQARRRRRAASALPRG
ncbi:MAG TPA: hypothetical protein VH592_16280 [Gemmataceae bacterium]